jgi:hypothetical protein
VERLDEPAVVNRNIAALVVAFIAMCVVHERLLTALQWPLPDDHDRLVTFSPTEPFVTVLVVFYASISQPCWSGSTRNSAPTSPAVGRRSRRSR